MDEVKYEEEFILSAKGSKLFTCRWLPRGRSVKALVFLCHGYGMECSVFMKGTGIRLAEAGYAVFGIDYEGHGRSEGRRCYIESFYALVDDCVSYYRTVRALPPFPAAKDTSQMNNSEALYMQVHNCDVFDVHLFSAEAIEEISVCEALSGEAPLWHQAMDSEYKSLMDNATCELVPAPPNQKLNTCKWLLQKKYHADGSLPIQELEEFKDLPRFLYGESMGGAVALLVHRKEPIDWNGAVLVAPMCKIAEESKTHPLIENILTKLCSAFPTWKIVPTKDVIEASFKDPGKRQEIRQNPYIYQDRPRVKTALEMLLVSMDLEQRLDEVTLPFLVLHGEDDKVTDPSVSKALFDSALSFDKEMKLYPGMWHGLTSGEPDDNIQLVFNDIIGWLDKRSKSVSLDEHADGTSQQHL
ncbi:hypothetical protein KP509_19G015900 [Ceratopteris richardii]|uniref:Serine aminopeptidase S33 domain-containing protein n=1 Tax=Ceratopteris richardii TaxID=49495 RepID=A0A8T2SM88_CERRI|nr:hypothetical protein KP509_19G015900 [Ceratopteris richardii]